MNYQNEINIENKIIGNNQPCYIIAEIGVNHNGDLILAKKLIDAAIESGADAVKFQKRNLESLYRKEALENPNSESQGFEILLAELKKIELSKEIERLSSPKEIPILSDEERNNLQMLYDMLNSSDYDLLMKAEIRRELGQFEDAEEILKHRYDKNYSKHWSIIKKLVEKRDPYSKHWSIIKKLVEKRDPNVAEIKFED